MLEEVKATLGEGANGATEIKADESEVVATTAPEALPDGEAEGEVTSPDESEESEAAPDYDAIMQADVEELRESFPELSSLQDICELQNPLRYAELRDLGLTAREAYLATASRARRDNRGHLTSAVPRGAGAPRGGMSRDELTHMRELFPGLGDAELQGLYRKVSL